tara:strand:- start:73 stop:264 length:192 start_codon:yes stop_codon:yes gene_type:complete
MCVNGEIVGVSDDVEYYSPTNERWLGNSVICGDMYVGATHNFNMTNIDPGAIARAAIEAYVCQ